MIRRRQLLAIAAAALIAGPALASGEQKKKGGGLNFIQLETLTATVFKADGRRGVMTVDVGVDIPDAGLHARAQMAAPRLRAAYVQMVQAYASGLGPGMPPNADYIARILQSQTDLVLGRPGARFLIGAIMIN